MQSGVHLNCTMIWFHKMNKPDHTENISVLFFPQTKRLHLDREDMACASFVSWHIKLVWIFPWIVRFLFELVFQILVMGFVERDVCYVLLWPGETNYELFKIMSCFFFYVQITGSRTTIQASKHASGYSGDWLTCQGYLWLPLGRTG